MHTQIILVSLSIVVSMARLPEGFEEPELTSMITTNETENFRAVSTVAKNILTDFELRSLLRVAYFNFMIMSDAFAQATKHKGLDKTTYYAASQILNNITSIIETSVISSKYKGVVGPEVRSIQHEAQCIDERVSVIGKLSPNETKEMLQTCIFFSWDTYSAELQDIQQSLNDIMKEYDHFHFNDTPLTIVVTSIFLVGDLKERYQKLQGINIRKWATKYNFVSLFFANKNVTVNLVLVEARIKQYEEDQFKSDVWDSTHDSIIQPSVLITSLLAKVEAELHALTKPRYLTQTAVNRRVCVQKLFFHRLLKKVNTMRISLSPEAGAFVYKIRFLLGFFEAV